MPIGTSHAEIELSFHNGQDGRYETELRFTDPECQVERAPIRGVAAFDAQALLASECNPDEYGRRLTAQVFADLKVRTLYGKARAAVEHAGRTLRVRVAVGSATPRLHDFRWELLRDPETDAPLATSERILLSRLLYSSDWRTLEPRPRTPLRAVIAAASPSDLADYGLAEIDVGAEIAAVEGALSGLQLTILGRERPLTLECLIEALRAGADIVYLLCHGVLGNRPDPSLFLQDEEGKVARVSGRDLARRISEMPVTPRLVVLAACESAGRHVDATRPAFARLLADAGVLAVLAMQGEITAATVRSAMPPFFRELVKDGQVDRALAVARGAVRGRSDHWMLALYLRLRGGRLWTDSTWDAVAIPPEQFFRAWLDPNKGHNHCWNVVGRERLCREIVNLVVGRSHRALVLEGRGGIGKSKVLFELAQCLTAVGVQVRAYQEGSATSMEALAECPEGPHVLLLDDAHRLDPVELATIVAFAVRRRSELRLIFACRPYGAEPILRACTNAGIDPAAVLHRLIPNLDAADRLALAAQALGPAHGRHAETLASCFPDSPLFITVAGVSIRQGNISIAEIRGSEDLRRLVLSRFPHNDIARPAVPGGEAALQAIVGVLALLLPISMKTAQTLAATVTGVPHALEVMITMIDLGIFAEVNGRLRILPDLYGSYTALAWALPKKVSFGRICSLWRCLSDNHLRDSLLENLVEVMRDLASPNERRALRAELAEIWAERERDLGSPAAAFDWQIVRHLELMATELSESAVDLAERLTREAGDAAPPECCASLVKAALKYCEPGDTRLPGRGIALLVRIAADGRQAALKVLCELGEDGRYTDAIVDAIEVPIRRVDCPPELFGRGLEVVERAMHARLHAPASTGRIPELLAYHRRITEFLTGAMFSCPASSRRSEAIRSALQTLVVTWDRCGRDHAAIADAGQWHAQAAAFLQRVDHELAADPVTSYGLRKALREHVCAVGAELAVPVLTLIRKHSAQIDRIDDVLDVTALPLELFESRVRGRPPGDYFADDESIRAPALLRLLSVAPDLEVFRRLERSTDLESLVRLVIEDAILASPAHLVRSAGTWVTHTIRTPEYAQVLRLALLHRFPVIPQDREPQLAQLYARSRLDEVYGCAIVRHSESTAVFVAAHMNAIRDVPLRMDAARQAADILLSWAEDAAAVWRELQRRTEKLQLERPRLYFILHAIAEARMDLVPGLIELITRSGSGSVDTLPPLLNALWAHAPEETRQLASTLVAHDGAALAVATTLVRWIAGPADERELLRAVLGHANTDVQAQAFVALGVLMARRPEEAGEFLRGPLASPSAQHLEALMQGFLGSHLIRKVYVPDSCEHIEQWFAPVGRAFAARMIHPRGPSDFEPAAQLAMARLSRLFVDPSEPAWERMPAPLVEQLIRAMVAGDGGRSRSAQQGEGGRTFIVECVRRWPSRAFSTFLQAQMDRAGASIDVPADLVEATIRPLAEAARGGILDILLDAARRERANDVGPLVTPQVFVAAYRTLEAPLFHLLDGTRPIDEERLLDAVHLFRTLDYRHIFAFYRFLEAALARAREFSAVCLNRVWRLFPTLDSRAVERSFLHTTPEDIAEELAWMDRILALLGEDSSVGPLLRQIRDLVRREHVRALREVEV